MFISCLSKYLLDERIQKTLVKINPYTVKFGSLVIGNNYGMSSTLYVTLSLVMLDKEEKEIWECILYECDDFSENEVESRSFDNGKIAVELKLFYQINYIKK